MGFVQGDVVSFGDRDRGVCALHESGADGDLGRETDDRGGDG